MSIGVIYYSRDNSTKQAAEMLGEKLKAKILELKEKTSRKGIFGFLSGGFQAVRGKSSKLVDTPWDEISQFETLYLMTPVWAGKGTPAMNTFLENADLSGKKIVIVTIQADPNFGGSDKTHEYLRTRAEDKNGTVEKCYAFHGAAPGKAADVEYLRNQLQKIDN